MTPSSTAAGLQVTGLSLTYGGVDALRAVDLSVEVGQVQGLIGPNGAGKTSLLNVISGVSPPDAGEVTLGGRRITGLGPARVSRAGLARTFQNIQVFEDESAFVNVLLGAEARSGGGIIRTVCGTPATRRAGTRSRALARDCLALVGLEDKLDVKAGAMPYGTKRMLEIARALATSPRILLLDEPAAGLNGREKQDLASVLASIAAQGVGIVLVEHDMDLVMTACHSISVLESGAMIAHGRPDEIKKNERVIAAYLGSDTEAD